MLRKEKVDKDDNSESDMDMSDDEEDKKQIETNVPMPAMMPRSIRFVYSRLLSERSIGYSRKCSKKRVQVKLTQNVNHSISAKPGVKARQVWA